MRSKRELTKAGVKYEQCRWEWLRPSYKLSTCEFSSNYEYCDMDYKQYLGLWADRLNRQTYPYSITAEKFIIIKTKRCDNNFITLVEVLNEKDNSNI